MWWRRDSRGDYASAAAPEDQGLTQAPERMPAVPTTRRRFQRAIADDASSFKNLQSVSGLFQDSPGPAWAQ